MALIQLRLPVKGDSGVPLPVILPGYRQYGAASWTDNNNNLWLFGGMTALGHPPTMEIRYFALEPVAWMSYINVRQILC